jgi:hypothetical protein
MGSGWEVKINSLLSNRPPSCGFGWTQEGTQMKKAFAHGLLVVTTLLFTSPLTVKAETVERSLDDFLAAQGSFCIPDGVGGCQQFLAPLTNQLGWEDPERNRCAVVDYLGSADAWLQEQSSGAISLGTTVTGTVKEHTMEDSRAQITVRLVVSNALTYAVSGCNILGGPLVFGARPQEVLNGATPSLADATFGVEVHPARSRGSASGCRRDYIRPPTR